MVEEWHIVQLKPAERMCAEKLALIYHTKLGRTYVYLAVEPDDVYMVELDLDSNEPRVER